MYRFIHGCVVLAAMVPFGCRQEDPVVPDAPDGPEVSPGDEPSPTIPCENDVVYVSIDDGATDVYYRSVIRAELAEADQDAKIIVFGGDGISEVSGETDVVLASLVWHGDPLQPNADYVAEVRHACGVDFTKFTTSDIGMPLESSIVNKVYAFNAFGADFIEPENVGPFLRTIIGQSSILVQPVQDPSETLLLRTGLGDDDAQELCMPTVDMPSTWEDPYFRTPEMNVEIHTADYQFDIHAFGFTGAFASDGSSIQGGTMSGWLDTRALNEQVFGEGAAPDELCGFLSDFGAPCLPCDDGALLCISLLVENVDALPVDIAFEAIPVEGRPPRCE